MESALPVLCVVAGFVMWGGTSYGLYLYHWPIYLLVDSERAGSLFGVERVTGWSLLALHLTLTAVVSVLSFHLIEQPFVKRKVALHFEGAPALDGCVRRGGGSGGDSFWSVGGTYPAPA